MPAARLAREWTTTVIPSAASRRAVAAPIPDADPVTNATFRIRRAYVRGGAALRPSR
ncbi:hypothetical protein GCM10010532_027370 [Dactylosporangium siamense]|uniref:Uncharacterized protein n=1 Tax=Dactylosporangium siamense TaxID=685454 RepID=A0A919PFT0_9ACTN|nr:hypothetical protein Dsi01nite_004820 [Dactylosporangium siamense]